MHDLVIRGGTLVDGTGEAPAVADVAVDDGIVTEVGRLDGAAARHTIDAEGLTVEDFGLTDNLMMIHALDLHGCALVMPPHAPADMWHDLTAFETCVLLAAERLGVIRKTDFS